MNTIEEGLIDAGPNNKFEYDPEKENMVIHEIKSQQWETTGFEINELDKEKLNKFLEDKKIWRCNRNKACGPDGWYEEESQLLKRISEKPKQHMNFMFEKMYEFETIFTHSQFITCKPMLKPQSPSDLLQHNHFRKLSLMSIQKKRLEWIVNEMQRKIWKPPPSQDNFQRGKGTAQRILTEIVLFDSAKERDHTNFFLMMLDSPQYFDCIQPAILIDNMRQETIEIKARRMSWNLNVKETMRVDSGCGLGDKHVKCAIGAAQGSSCGPLKGIIHAAERRTSTKWSERTTL